MPFGKTVNTNFHTYYDWQQQDPLPAATRYTPGCNQIHSRLQTGSDNTDQSIPEQVSIRASPSMDSRATGATCKDEELVGYRRLLSSWLPAAAAVLLPAPGCCCCPGSSAAAASWWSVQLGCSPSTEFPVEPLHYLYFFGPSESKTFYTNPGESDFGQKFVFSSEAPGHTGSTE